jgi:hypothetical protein
MPRQRANRRLIFTTPGAEAGGAAEATHRVDHAGVRFAPSGDAQSVSAGSCAYCKDPRCLAARAPEPCIHCDVRVYAEVDEGANKIANSPFRAEPIECCVCEAAVGAARVVFVPPCFKTHAVCASCLLRWWLTTQPETSERSDAASFFSCVMCRAQIRLPLSRLWFACLLASGATGRLALAPHVAPPLARFTLTPPMSLADMLCEVRAGVLSVRTASRLLGSPPEDDHVPARCAVPECFQCAALSWMEPSATSQRTHVAPQNADAENAR